MFATYDAAVHRVDNPFVIAREYVPVGSDLGRVFVRHKSAEYRAMVAAGAQAKFYEQQEARALALARGAAEADRRSDCCVLL
ncbi:hypothetical protein DDE05_59730 [Streptomyces cavourensis]|nr:hypothetical protein DDE05_59730 [Streptomyces cavourensis]